MPPYITDITVVISVYIKAMDPAHGTTTPIILDLSTAAVGKVGHVRSRQRRNCGAGSDPWR